MNRHPSFLFAVACTVILIAAGGAAFAADHRDGPRLTDSLRFGSRDINDVYVFRSPASSKNTVLVMTTNPFAGVLSPTSLNDDVFYELVIDNNGDAREDLVYRYRYIDIRALRTQLVLVTRLDKRTILGQLGIGTFVSAGFTGSTLSTLGGGKTTTGIFDDPFFFDLNGFNNGFNFTGDNFFEASNVNAIVLEVPTKSLLRTGRNATTNIGVWGRIVSQGSFGLGIDATQFDRMGRPAINTALIFSENKDAFNRGQPVNDQADFREDVVAKLLGLGNTQERADVLADVLLPDILTFDTASSAGFLNGRKLADDVIDAELNLLSNGAVTTDDVDENDKAFRTKFPYLAAPHRMPEEDPLGMP